MSPQNIQSSEVAVTSLRQPQQEEVVHDGHEEDRSCEPTRQAHHIQSRSFPDRPVRIAEPYLSHEWTMYVVGPFLDLQR